jgi:hypothetical protein
VAATIFLFGFGLAPVWLVAYLCIAVSGLACWFMLFAVPLSFVAFGIATAALSRYFGNFCRVAAISSRRLRAIDIISSRSIATTSSVFG